MTYLGIDGGGSKTTFLLVDDSDSEIQRIPAGGSNLYSSGAEAVRAAIRAGAVQLNVRPDVVCAGFAGAGRPEGIAFYREVLKSLFPTSTLRIESDAFIAYIGAIGVQPGVIVIAGTGSIAVGRKQDGTMLRVGGWGPHLGDEGGGYWIGLQALSSALRAHDRGGNDRFVAAVVQALGLDSIVDVPAAGLGTSQIAGLFPTVAAYFPAEPAGRIVREAAAHLNELVAILMRRVDVEDFPVSYAGSVVAHPVVRQFIHVPLTEPLQSPEWGAVTWARHVNAR